MTSKGPKCPWVDRYLGVTFFSRLGVAPVAPGLHTQTMFLRPGKPQPTPAFPLRGLRMRRDEASRGLGEGSALVRCVTVSAGACPCN